MRELHAARTLAERTTGATPARTHAPEVVRRQRRARRDSSRVERADRAEVHAEAVVLARDLDLAREQVLHRLVAAAVPVLELVRRRARARARASGARGRCRRPAPRRAARAASRTGTATADGSPGPFAKKTPSGSQREHLVGGRRGRHDGDLAAGLGEPAQDVVLHARVERDDAVARPRPGGRRCRRAARPCGPSRPHAIRLASTRRRVTRSRPTIAGHAVAPSRRATPGRGPSVEIDRAHRAALAQVPREPPRVDALDRDDARARAGTRGSVCSARQFDATRRHLAHHEARRRRRRATPCRRAFDAVVADVRHRHRDDLPGVAAGR